MKPKFSQVWSFFRKPVKRAQAETYLLITLLSFAASVSLTRLFLEITGYPQLGGGDIHIAHVLWGGLLLFIAALLPLIWANRWVYSFSALIAGIGVGLFIDEVGKFITQNNDYFHPSAAPIIYAFFLLIVLLYVNIRRPVTRDVRLELYQALEALEEILENDLDPEERDDLKARLQSVISAAPSTDQARLAQVMLEFIDNPSITLAPKRILVGEKLAQRWDKRKSDWISRKKLRAIIIFGLISLGLIALLGILLYLPMGISTTALENRLSSLIRAGELQSNSSYAWYYLRIVLETIIGILLLLSAGYFLAGKERIGIALGYISLLISLTTVNIIIFYFDQFSTILKASLELILLIILIYYRKYYFHPAPVQTAGVEDLSTLPSSQTEETL